MNMFVSYQNDNAQLDKSDKSDLHLWLEVKSGDKTALSLLYKKYVDMLYKYGMKMCADSELVEDVIHDVFVVFWESRNKIHIKDSLKYYLISAFRRKLVSLIKDKKQIYLDNKHVDFIAAVDSLETSMIRTQEEQEKLIRLRKCVSELSKKQKEAIYLKYYENMDYDEISHIMGVGLKHTYNLVSKAVTQLKKIINPALLFGLFI